MLRPDDLDVAPQLFAAVRRESHGAEDHDATEQRRKPAGSDRTHRWLHLWTG
jgi:hypothetical protein